MEIYNVAPEPKLVEDWDFISTNGFMLPITIDPSLGEYCKIEGTVATIHQVAKDSTLDPDRQLSPEDNIVILTNVFFIRKRLRPVQDATVEQKEEWKQVLKQMAGNPRYPTT